MAEIKYKKYIRRPPNAFFIFSNEKRKELLNQNPGIGNRNVSRMLGTLWSELDFDKKREFIKKAEELYDKHLREFPGYKFNAWTRKRLRDRQYIERNTSTVQSSAVNEDRINYSIIWDPANQWPTTQRLAETRENAADVQSVVYTISPEKQIFMISLGLCQPNSTEYLNLMGKQAANRQPVICIIQNIGFGSNSKPKPLNKSNDPVIKVKRPRGRPRKHFPKEVCKRFGLTLN